MHQNRFQGLALTDAARKSRSVLIPRWECPRPESADSPTRKWVERGESPAKAKRREKTAKQVADTVRQFAEPYAADVVRVRFSRAKDAERYFTRDIFPALGTYRLAEVTPPDLLRLIDAVKARGKRKAQESEKSRGVMRRRREGIRRQSRCELSSRTCSTMLSADSFLPTNRFPLFQGRASRLAHAGVAHMVLFQS